MTIVGAGLVGLTLARALLQRGAGVTVVDAGSPGGGASGAAAGMLGATHEALTSDDRALHALGFAAADLWPGYAAGLGAETGIDCAYRSGPTLAIARSDGEAAALMRAGAGHGLRRVDPQEALPGCTGPVAAAFWMPRDGQVDPAAVIKALLVSVRQRGGVVETGQPVDPTEIAPPGGDGVVVDARGWQAAFARPVKGAALALAPGPGLPADHVVRFGATYLVPKQGRVILGASVEPGLSGPAPSRERLEELIETAAAVFPAVGEAEVLARWAGVRPGSPVDAPLAGWRAPSRYVLTGHHRNGVLLAPLTAEAAARHILEGEALPEGLADVRALGGARP